MSLRWRRWLLLPSPYRQVRVKTIVGRPHKILRSHRWRRGVDMQDLRLEPHPEPDQQRGSMGIQKSDTFEPKRL